MLVSITRLLLAASIFVSAPLFAKGQRNHEKKSNLVDLEGMHPKFLFDIRYATADNFFGKKVYSEPRCLLLQSTARKVLSAQKWLDKNHPQLKLLFKDCYRPHPVQHILWNAVKGTKKARYVANPNTRTGSLHSYGASVDLTLADKNGSEVDMGTAYDHLGRRAEPRHEKTLLAQGALTRAQVENRKILRRAMLSGGKMKMIRNEWWHFNEATAREIQRRYPRRETPFSSVPRKSKERVLKPRPN